MKHLRVFPKLLPEMRVSGKMQTAKGCLIPLYSCIVVTIWQEL